MAVLADRIRPETVDEVVGQEHLLAENKPLRSIIESKNIPSMIFYGPCGTGKTTLARIIAKNSKLTFRKLNATTASTADLKDIFNDTKTFCGLNGILLYLDEIQYFNKKQQQTLLEYMENGKITLIASTSENPYFSVYNAVLSRSTVFEFKTVSKENIIKALIRAVKFLENENNEQISIQQKTLECIASSAGDVRKAINILEICYLCAAKENNKRIIDFQTAASIIKNNSMKYDKKDDEHYDLLSAFQKSMRGSDPDAAIHYLARLLNADDLFSVCRRLMVCACEDVGLSYPQIIPIVKSCVDAAFQLGMPEARIPLADAVILVCLCPKSNSAYMAINQAMEDIKNGNTGQIPRHLQNKHFDGEDNPLKGQFYNYPHDFKNAYVSQQYLPNELVGSKYYEYADNKMEQSFKKYW
ncbi:MAG: replication-associated recombination protein A, partial [Clostridia bacterium]|nr:replication-associated recombination protein A [Clostridia bacterium]